MSTGTQPVDFVVTWVDGSDPAWRREKEYYSALAAGTGDGTDRLSGDGKSADGPADAKRGAEKSGGFAEGGADDREERYRDYELLRYWFRGVEQYAPWVRKVFFVTWGHVPGWLDTEHPKLEIVRHSDYIPGEYLPTFNSNVIELFFHRIPGLSEHFVYFNDDFFPMSPMTEELFFRRGYPCDMLAFQPIVANPDNPVMSHTFLNNMLLLAKYFDKRENVRRQPAKYFRIGYPPLYFGYNFLELAFPRYTGLYTVHGAFPFTKKSYREVWKREERALREAASHRFRQKEDLSIYVFREWQKLTGEFIPRNVERDLAYFDLTDDNTRLLKMIRKTPRRKKVLCINDANRQIDFDRVKRELGEAFGEHFPSRSSYELAEWMFP